MVDPKAWAAAFRGQPHGGAWVLPDTATQDAAAPEHGPLGLRQGQHRREVFFTVASALAGGFGSAGEMAQVLRDLITAQTRPFERVLPRRRGLARWPVAGDPTVESSALGWPTSRHRVLPRTT